MIALPLFRLCSEQQKTSEQTTAIKIRAETTTIAMTSDKLMTEARGRNGDDVASVTLPVTLWNVVTVEWFPVNGAADECKVVGPSPKNK